MGLGTEPVAITTVPASISVPSHWPPIFTLPSSVTEPCPSMYSILFFLKSPLTPPVSVFTTFSRCLETPEKSTDTSFTTMPRDLPPSASVRTSAARRTLLAGMHA